MELDCDDEKQTRAGDVVEESVTGERSGKEERWLIFWQVGEEPWRVEKDALGIFEVYRNASGIHPIAIPVQSCAARTAEL